MEDTPKSVDVLDNDSDPNGDPLTVTTLTPDAAHGTVSFVDMPPGWHITTGPSVILYDPARTATGAYRVRSESFLFDPGTRREGYGLLIGGR